MPIRRREFLSLVAAGAAAAVSPAAFTPAWAQGASTLERIKQTKQLRIGVTSAEPWFFKDPMSGSWSGVGVTMGQQLAAELGAALVPVETTWANCVAALQADQIDLMFVLDPTEERRKAIDFPEAPLFYYALGALVRSDGGIKNWSDLDKPETKIGVTLGTSVDRTITETMKAAAISRFATNDEAVAAFAARRVDVVAQFHPALVVQYARLKLGKVLLPQPVSAVATSAGLRREADPAFRTWVSTKFAEYYAEGKPQGFFTEYLKGKGIDPATVPGLVKEKWS
jgi:polar amino acid transport system substrate-binding protein